MFLLNKREMWSNKYSSKPYLIDVNTTSYVSWISIGLWYDRKQ